jgi:hypothetical protein
MPVVPGKRFRPNVLSQNVSKESKALSGSTFAMKPKLKPTSLFDSKVKPVPVSIAPDYRPKLENPVKKSLQQQLVRALTNFTLEVGLPKTFMTMQVRFIKKRQGI